MIIFDIKYTLSSHVQLIFKSQVLLLVDRLGLLSLIEELNHESWLKLKIPQWEKWKLGWRNAGTKILNSEGKKDERHKI